MTYKDRGPHQNMSDSQRAFFDYTEEAGMYGGRRKAKAEAEAWKAKRDNMTRAELEEMEQQDELNKWTGKWMLIGIGVVLAVVCTLLIIGEVTGNPLLE